MKYGIYYSYWQDSWSADFVKYIEKAARLGFDILEINASSLADCSDREISEVKKRVSDNNIILTAGYGPKPEHNVADENARSGALNWYKRVFEAMDKLDIRVIGGAIYSYWPVDYSKKINKSEDLRKSIEGTRQLAAIAKECGVTICCEVLNRFENYLLNTAAEAVAFVKEVACDNVKVMLDTFHMNIEEDSFAAAIREVGPYLGHFHLGEANRRLPGEGRMPWTEIMDALIDIDYQGYAVMEPFVKRGGEVEVDIKIWRDLLEDTSEEKLDKAAANSVSFLKALEKMRRQAK